MSDDTLTLEALRERVGEIRVAMLTTIDQHGALSSRPLAVQRIGDNGDAFFVVERNADWVHAGRPANVALVDPGRTWVSVAGTTELVTGTSLLSDLWDEHTDEYFTGDRADAVVLQVRADRWEYWTAPNRVAQMVGQAKAFLMDREPDVGDSGTLAT